MTNDTETTGGTDQPVQPVTETAEELAAKAAAKAEEERLTAEAAEASRKALNDPASLAAVKKPEEVVDENSVACFFPRRVLLTMNNHQKVEYTPGTHKVPWDIAVEYPNKDAKTGVVTKGMHFYLAAHGVKVVE